MGYVKTWNIKHSCNRPGNGSGTGLNMWCDTNTFISFVEVNICQGEPVWFNLMTLLTYK